MIVDQLLVGSLIITAIVMAFVLHESAHFFAGLLMGTVEYVDVVFPLGRYAGYAPLAIVVGQKRRNWVSTLAPIVWLIPFYGIYVLPDGVPLPLLLFGFLSFGVAGFSVFVSDIPHALGLFSFDGPEYKRVRLVDYT